MTESKPRPLIIRRESEAGSVTVRVTPRTFGLHYVTEPELDDLAETFSSINQVYLGIASSTFVAFVITVLTMPGLDPGVHAAFVGFIAISALAIVYFGWQVRRERERAAERIRRIREQQAA